MRRAAICWAVLLVASCDPEIGAGTYFCGPDMLCPPDLECNPYSFTCELPGSFAPFACPEGSTLDEPDDTSAQAGARGELSCSFNAEPLLRCAADEGDVDYLEFTMAECFGNDPRVEVEVRFPVAMASLEFDVLDESDNVVASGEPCTPETNFTGMEWLCAEVPPIAGAYFVRVRTDGSANCSGDCAFNQYLLYLRYPLS